MLVKLAIETLRKSPWYIVSIQFMEGGTVHTHTHTHLCTHTALVPCSRIFCDDENVANLCTYPQVTTEHLNLCPVQLRKYIIGGANKIR